MVRSVKAKGIEVPMHEDYAFLEGRGAGLQKAFRRGARASSRGTPTSSCPYSSGRGSGAYRRAWMRGHLAYKQSRETAE